MEFYRTEYEFVEFIPLSGLKGDNTKLLVQKILEHLPVGPPLFEEDALTDQTDSNKTAVWYRRFFCIKV